MADNVGRIQDEWTLSLESFPSCFEMSVIYQYFVVNGNSEDFKHKEEGYRMFRSGHVKNVLFNPNVQDNTSCSLKARVLASMKGQTYLCFIHISKSSGTIQHAECPCKCGVRGKCKHVAAVLYQIIDYKESSFTEIPSDVACTEQPCQWNKPIVKQARPVSTYFDQLEYNKYSAEKPSKRPCRVNNAEIRESYSSLPESSKILPQSKIQQLASRLEPNLFSQLLMSNNCNPVKDSRPLCPVKSVVVTTTHEDKNCDAMVEKLFPIHSQQVATVPELPEPLQSFYEKYLQESDVVLIEKLTRGQNKTPRWFKERKLRLTASTFGDIYGLRETTDPAKLLQRLTSSKELKVAAVQWGTINEAVALAEYKKLSSDAGANLSISRSGLVVDSTSKYLGATPDGIVLEPNEEGFGILEIKCPESKKDVSPEQAAEDPKFYCYLENGKLKLKKNTKYYRQVQGQIGVTRAKWCDFCVWTPKGLSIEKIFLDVKLWDSMKLKLTKFYFEVYLTYIYENSSTIF